MGSAARIRRFVNNNRRLSTDCGTLGATPHSSTEGPGLRRGRSAEAHLGPEPGWSGVDGGRKSKLPITDIRVAQTRSQIEIGNSESGRGWALEQIRNGSFRKSPLAGGGCWERRAFGKSPLAGGASPSRGYKTRPAPGGSGRRLGGGLWFGGSGGMPSPLVLVGYRARP